MTPRAVDQAETHLENYERRELSAQLYVAEQDRGVEMRRIIPNDLVGTQAELDAEARHTMALIPLVLFCGVVVAAALLWALIAWGPGVWRWVASGPWWAGFVGAGALIVACYARGK